MLLSTISSTRSIFEHPLGRITQQPGQAIELQWLAGPRDVAAVQTLCEQLARTYQRTGCCGLLIDERLASSFQEEAKRWLVEQWLPRLAQEPAYARVAVVMATEVYARLSSVTIQAAAQGLRLPYRAFSREEEARQWLSQRERKGRG